MSASLVANATPTSGPGESGPLVRTRTWKSSIGLGAVALLSLLIFGLGTPASTETTFAVASNSDFIQLPSLTLPSKLAAVLFSVVGLLLAGWTAFRASQYRKVGIWVPVVFGVAIMGALLTWAGADRTGTTIQLTGLLTSALFLAVPLVFGALAGTICERSGIINIAIEGQLLAGAFLAALVASLVGNAYVGLIAAPIAGGLVGLLLAIFATKYWVNQIVVGVVLNLLVLGLTSFFLGSLMTDNPAFNQALGLDRKSVV